MDNLLRRDRRVVMPKVKLPSTKPTNKSRLPKNPSSTGARGSPPATYDLGDANCTDLLNDASEMLHRDDDMVSCGLRDLLTLAFYLVQYYCICILQYIKLP